MEYQIVAYKIISMRGKNISNVYIVNGKELNSKELNKIVRFGNFNNNDWYVFSGFTLTYTFGRKPCYCNF